jgi:hypothetical protein
MKSPTFEQMGIRFPVSDVKPASHALVTTKSLVALKKLLPQTQIESCCDYNSDVVPVDYHPLFAATHLAFNDHRPLVLSPDMIWLAIVQGVATHINLNSETLRHKFVQYEGKEKITVRRNDFRRGSPENPWPEVFSEFSMEIKARIGTKHTLFIENFSTTGAVENSAFEIALMDAMQSYFSFEVETFCGIPEITLEGKTEDWKKISKKLASIEKLGLSFWINKLEPVLEQFIRASQGNIDSVFWQSLYKVNDFSGGPYINGWLTYFLPYIDKYIPGQSEIPNFLSSSSEGKVLSSGKGEWMLVENPALIRSNNSYHGITLKQLPSGISKAPFVWKFFGNNFDYDFLGGFVGVTQNVNTFAIRPKIGWAVGQQI